MSTNFRLINEQDLIIAFCNEGCSWLDARMLALIAKTKYMFSELSIPEIVQEMLSDCDEEDED